MIAKGKEKNPRPARRIFPIEREGTVTPECPHKGGLRWHPGGSLGKKKQLRLAKGEGDLEEKTSKKIDALGSPLLVHGPP